MRASIRLSGRLAAVFVAAASLLSAADAGMGLPNEIARTLAGKRAVTLAATGTCNPNRVTFRIATSQEGTTAIDFVNVPGGYVNINVGGTSPSCVIATFSASARANNSIMFVRARIQQLGAIAEPASAFFAEPSGVFFKAHSMQFVFPNIPPGQYTVRAQFRSQNGQLVVVGSRTLTVEYRAGS
jgi:hypothetical protein